MAKPEWGTKRVCQSCSARFYDLGRTPITCPACNAIFDLEVLTRSRRTRAVARPEVDPDEETATARIAPVDGELEDAEAEPAGVEADDEEDEVAIDPVVADTDDEDVDTVVIEDTADLTEDADEDVLDDDLTEDPDDQR